VGSDLRSLGARFSFDVGEFAEMLGAEDVCVLDVTTDICCLSTEKEDRNHMWD
jgi:hypothetical protein